MKPFHAVHCEWGLSQADPGKVHLTSPPLIPPQGVGVAVTSGGRTGGQVAHGTHGLAGLPRPAHAPAVLPGVAGRVSGRALEAFQVVTGMKCVFQQ